MISVYAMEVRESHVCTLGAIMSGVSLGKKLLRNVIRHTDIHNKVCTLMKHWSAVLLLECLCLCLNAPVCHLSSPTVAGGIGHVEAERPGEASAADWHLGPQTSLRVQVRHTLGSPVAGVANWLGAPTCDRCDRLVRSPNSGLSNSYTVG